MFDSIWFDSPLNVLTSSYFTLLLLYVLRGLFLKPHNVDEYFSPYDDDVVKLHFKVVFISNLKEPDKTIPLTSNVSLGGNDDLVNTSKSLEFLIHFLGIIFFPESRWRRTKICLWALACRAESISLRYPNMFCFPCVSYLLVVVNHSLTLLLEISSLIMRKRVWI